MPRADNQDASAVGRQHRLFAVDDEIEENLLNLVAVGKHLRKPGGEGVDDRDVGESLLVRAQGERFADHLVDVHQRARRLTLAGEGEEVAHEAGGALRFAEDRLEPAADGILERLFL